MSQPNHFQPWKQNRPLGIPPNVGGNNSYGKLPAVAHQNPPQTAMHHHLHQQQQHPQHPLAVMMGFQDPQEQGMGIQSAATSSSTSVISSSTGPLPNSSGGNSGQGGGMGDFLAQLGANKLMLNKLSASYGLGSLPVGMSLDHPAAGQHQAAMQNQLSPLDDCANDKEREVRIQQIFENAIGDTSKKQIVEILEKISILRPPERLLLYLRMPGGYPETDPLRQSQNPLGTRSEINHTINWVRSHLEHDPNVSIPKQEVYDDYTAFCERIDIKPLSTADFGKVMKQVFPGIRPRRLGTRGHSRYCYAAMRKATKLAAPKLPDLSSSSTSTSGSTGGGEKKSDPEDQVPTDEEAWKVIKLWAEAMLPGAFGSINELAGFITKHNLNSPASIASRQQLQKKLLQREIKERKKLTAAALKKRRRKRRKTLSTSLDSEVATPPTGAPSSSSAASRDPNAQLKATSETTSSSVAASTVLQQVKLERPDYTDEDNNNTPPTPMTAAVSIKQQQQHQHQQLSTNLNCDTSNNALVAASATLAAGRQMRSPAEEYILCKKVRQAQQLKAAAQSQQSVPQQMMPNPLRTASAAAKRAASIAHLARQKRLRLLQQQQQRSIEAQNNSAPSYDEMGNLILIESQDLVTSSSKEDFIIPRERVISICNMDKNALDDYLNCKEENSQDQDQELLQYFPEENQVDDGGGNPQGMGSGNCAGTSLETGGFGMPDDHDTNFKLSQLRSMLEQNMNQGGGMDKPQVGGQLDGFDGSGQQLNLQPGSASASLAMLSQRHHGSTVSSLDSNTCNSTDTKKSLNANMKLALEGCLNSLGNGSANMNVNNGTPLQSPNGRRKNYDFVPISAGPQSPRVPLAKSSHQNSTPNASPFVSPRNTPIHRKSKPPNNGLTLNIMQQNQPSLQLPGYHPRPGFVKNELSASAPPSPSMVQNYRFGMNHNVLNCPSSVPSFQPICGPSSQMQPHQNMQGSLESRSSSVPLIPNYDAYNHSNYTSVSQTPVPSECDDFSDPNNILDMLNEPSSSTANIQQSIKLEESEPMMSDILDQDDMFPKASVPFSSLSRSVPSTPLPHQMSFNHNHQNIGASFGSSNGTSSGKALFELPKSVPSTPISLNNNRESLFQYSPETSRDYLINGNSVDRTNKMGGPFYSNQAGANVNAVTTGGGGGGGNASVASGGPTGTANGTAASAVPSSSSSGSGTEMSILADGIESLTDALIGSDTLRYL